MKRAFPGNYAEMSRRDSSDISDVVEVPTRVPNNSINNFTRILFFFFALERSDFAPERLQIQVESNRTREEEILPAEISFHFSSP